MTPHQDQMARRLCQLLDSAADDLSPRIQSRLATARGQCARTPGRDHPRDQPHRAQPGALPRLLAHARQAPAWSRLALTAIPAILLALAALAGSFFTQERTVIQQADAYTEMLTADVPLSAYTDNGFAAHLQGGMMRTSASARDR
ncbi:DUF3619 family protein [Lautropia mirabilis]